MPPQQWKCWSNRPCSARRLAREKGFILQGGFQEFTFGALHRKCSLVRTWPRSPLCSTGIFRPDCPPIQEWPESKVTTRGSYWRMHVVLLWTATEEFCTVLCCSYMGSSFLHNQTAGFPRPRSMLRCFTCVPHVADWVTDIEIPSACSLNIFN